MRIAFAGLRLCLQPIGFGGEMARIRNKPRQIPNLVAVYVLKRLPSAAIHPDEAIAKRLALRIDGDAAIKLAGYAHCFDVSRSDICAVQGLGDGRSERSFPERRVLLGAIRPRKLRRIGAACLAQPLERAVGDDRLEALRADVDAEKHDGALAQQQLAFCFALTWP